MARRAKALNLLVGPMRPLTVGGQYDPGFHTLEVLSAAGLGVSYEHVSRGPVLEPMQYPKGPHGRTQSRDAAR